MLELLAGNRTAVLPRLARGRRIRSYPDLCASKFKKTNLKQGAHIHQPTPRPGQYLTLSIVFFHRIRNYSDIAIKVRVRFPFRLQFCSGSFQPLRLFILLRRSCSLACFLFCYYFSQVHFDAYNRRYGDDGIHESLEWDENEVAVATSNFLWFCVGPF